MSESIQAVKARYAAELLATPGVVSVGVGRDADGTAIVIVGTDRDVAEIRAAIPGELEGYKVRIDRVGKVRAR